MHAATALTTVLFLPLFSLATSENEERDIWDETLLSNAQVSNEAYNFKPAYLKNLYLNQASDSLTPEQCPVTTVTHHIVGRCTGKTMKDVYIIPHASIIHHGIRCGSGNKTDYMLMVPGTHVSSAKTAEIHGLTSIYKIIASNSRARNAFKILRGLDPVFVGVEYNGPRTCGDKQVFGKNSVFIFVIPSPKSKNLNFGFAYLNVLEVGMISVLTDRKICLYKETRKLGPGQAKFRTPTPSASPGIEYTLPANILDLDDATGLSTCFPATTLEEVVRPSPPPRPSASSTASTTPSNYPSPTTSASHEFRPSASRSAGASGLAGGGDPGRGEGGKKACFPGEGVVELEGGMVGRMSGLRVGDRVHVGGGRFSTVFMFTHWRMEGWEEFVEIRTRGNCSVRMSGGHYVGVGGRLRTARSVRVGESVERGHGGWDVVVWVGTGRGKGLFHPQTVDGGIVVDGILVSTFTEAVLPGVALGLLSPVKMLWRIGLRVWGFEEGGGWIVGLLPKGKDVW